MRSMPRSSVATPMTGSGGPVHLAWPGGSKKVRTGGWFGKILVEERLARHALRA